MVRYSKSTLEHLALVFLLVINLLLYMTAIGLWISISDEFTLNMATTVAALILSGIILIWKKEKFEIFYTSPQFKKFSSTALSVFLVFCIIGLLNYLSFKRPYTLDLSKFERNSLTSETVSMMKKLDGPLLFTIFSRKQEAEAIRPLIELYRFQKHDIKVDIVDIDLRPDLVQMYAITRSNSLLISFSGKKEVVDDISELAITNAIIKLSRDKDPMIMFSQGHGEIGIHDKSKEGMVQMLSILEKAHYLIRPVNLMTIPDLPVDLDLLVLWGPKQTLMTREMKMIETFLARGGKLLIALDPDFNKDMQGPLRKLIQKWGIRVDNNVVIDQVHHISGSQGTVPMMVSVKENHPILMGVEGPVFFPLTSSVENMGEIDLDGDVSTFLSTSDFPGSWADYNPKELIKGKITYHSAKDRRGPCKMMAVYQEIGKTKPVKMVVFGSSGFVQNLYSGYGRNFNLFHNAISWLTSDDLIESFNLPIEKNERIFMSSPQMRLIFFFAVFVPFLLLVIVAVLFYLRGRKL